MTRRRSAMRDVTEALEEDRIEAWYHPVVQLDTRKVIGVEALCRLRAPSGELIAASVFKDAMTDARGATDLTSRMLALSSPGTWPHGATSRFPFRKWC